MDDGPEMVLPARQPPRHLESIAVPRTTTCMSPISGSTLPRMHPRPQPMLRRHQTAMVSQHRLSRRSRGNTTTSGRSILPRRSSNLAIGWDEQAEVSCPPKWRMRSPNILFFRIASHSGSITTTSPQQRRETCFPPLSTLYQGAVIGGFARPGNLPESMLAVAGTASLFSEGPPRRIRPSQEPTVEEVPIAPAQAPKEIKGLGGTVDNSEAKIVWGGGIKDQGSTDWQPYVASQIPEATPKAETSKAFDLFNEVTGEAISDKTMDTLTVARIRNPLSIYGKLKTYVDQAKDYDEPRVDSDVEPDEITSRTIQLAVPEYTSPRQWLYLNLGIGYGRRRGVSVVITRIRE